MTVIDFLDKLNRKERFFLVGQALGNRNFTPAPDFLVSVAKATGVTFPEPDKVHCFMDFHLDWLYAALVLAQALGTGPFPSPEFAAADPATPSWNVNTNQEDVDLLLAFESAGATHLVLIEAKAATGWTVKQVTSKVRRLGRIFGNDGRSFDGVEPHFLLMSPEPSLALDEKLAAHPDTLPGWMRSGGRLSWAQLNMPVDRMLIVRCDEQGHPSKTGGYWRTK